MDKPEGPTSHDVVAIVRRAYGVRRVGHAGTLDPFATGLLIVLFGRATRLAPYLAGFDKDYRGTVTFGISTTTDDPRGEPLSTSDSWRTLSPDQIEDAMRGFVGTLAQVPPPFSAKKVAGRRAHRRARAGESVMLAPVAVTVTRFVPERFDPPALDFFATVGSGTYVRSLARDLGAAVGCPAHLSSLRRTRIGHLQVVDALPLDTARQGQEPVRVALELLPHLSRVELDAAALARVRKGMAITHDGDSDVAALVASGNLIAIAQRSDAALQPRVVFVD